MYSSNCFRESTLIQYPAQEQNLAQCGAECGSLIGPSADVQVSPYDTLHGSSSNRDACIKKLHNHRPGWTVAQICPDLVPGIICGSCNAEGLVTANSIMAGLGMTGRAHKNTVPPALLKHMAKHSLLCPIKIPFEHFIWSFAANSYATDQDINGCEHRAWNVLQKERSFEQMKSWTPTTPTKAGKLKSLMLDIVSSCQLLRRNIIDWRGSSRLSRLRLRLR